MQIIWKLCSWVLIKLISKHEYLIVPKGTKFAGSGELGLRTYVVIYHYKYPSSWEVFENQTLNFSSLPQFLSNISRYKSQNDEKWKMPNDILNCNLCVALNTNGKLLRFSNNFWFQGYLQVWIMIFIYKVVPQNIYLLNCTFYKILLSFHVKDWNCRNINYFPQQ